MRGLSGAGIRAGTSLVEIMIGVFILAIALLPIFGILGRSTGMTREERTEAAAVNFAAKIMKQYAYEYTWGNVTLGNSNGHGFLDNDPATGVEFQWSVEVTDAWAVSRGFAVKRTVYHNPCVGACSAGTEDLPKPAPNQINPAFCDRYSSCLFKNIRLTIQWRGPGQTGFDDIRRVVLVTRRAVLDEANQ